MELVAVCEAYRVEFLGQPASAVTSAAFVVAAVGILASRRRAGTQWDTPVRDRQTVVFGALLAGIGVGSFIQHGPHPHWLAYAHDLPLAATLMFVATDAARDLIGRDLIRRELSPGWWLVPTAAMVPVVALGSTASTVVQAGMAAAAIGLSLVRARRRPALRRTLITALATLAAGAWIGALADRTSFCQPDSLVQGHAVWHVLAAAALWRLGTAIGVHKIREADLQQPRAGAARLLSRPPGARSTS